MALNTLYTLRKSQNSIVLGFYNCGFSKTQRIIDELSNYSSNIRK
jgi:hypothetical protein